MVDFRSHVNIPPRDNWIKLGRPTCWKYDYTEKGWISIMANLNQLKTL